MDKTNGVIGVLALILFACIGGAYWLTSEVARVTNANTVRVVEAQAQQAQAWAREAEAAAQRAQAEKERELYAAAGYAIETQADLVDYYARRGDARIREGWQWLVGLAVVCFIVWLALRGQKNQLPACLPNEDTLLLEAPIRENTPLGV